MKKFTKYYVLMALLLVLSLVLGACGDSTATPASSGAATTAAGGSAAATGGNPKGSIVVGLVAEPTSMDPGVVTDINSQRILRNIYDSLIEFEDETFTVKPALATEWKVSDDSMTYTFKLRPNVKFHDGTPFNAEAVKFNFDRLMNDKDPTGPFPFASFFYPALKETKVVDDLTVQIIMSEPYSPFINNLTAMTAHIVSPAAVKKYGKDFGQNPVGTGPFKFVGWEKNVKVSLARNADYWGGAPKFETLIFRPIVEEQTRLTEFLAGNIDFIVDIPPDNMAQVQGSSKYIVLQQPGPHLWWSWFNTKKAPLNNVKVRQALSYAINREAISKDVLKNTGTVADSPIAPAMAWAYNNQLPKYNYDPAKAKQMLAEAGVSNLTLTYWVPESGSGMQSPKTMAQAIQADLKAVGVTVVIKTFEWGAMLQKYNSGMDQEADMSAISWMNGTGDPDLILGANVSSSAWSPKGFNQGYYKNDQVDKLMAEARKTSDQAKRADLYKQIQKLIVDDAPWIFIDNQIQNAAFSKKISGFKLHPSFLLQFSKTAVS